MFFFLKKKREKIRLTQRWTYSRLIYSFSIIIIIEDYAMDKMCWIPYEHNDCIIERQACERCEQSRAEQKERERERDKEEYSSF